MPLLWINLALATILGMIYYQPALFIPEKKSDFVIIAAGDREDASYSNARKGAEAFERDWGKRVSVIEGTTDPHALASALKYAMTLEPKGISLPGLLDDTLLLPFVTEAVRRGIVITFHTTPLDAAFDRFQDFGTGYVGADSQHNGERVAHRDVQLISPDDKAIDALVVGTGPTARPGSRTYGIMLGVEHYGGAADYLQFNPTAEKDAAAMSALAERLSKDPRPRIIFWDAGPLPPLTSTLERLKFDPAATAVVTFSITTGLPLAQQFFIKLQHDDQSTVASYMSLVQLHLTEKYQIPGMDIPLAASR